jgi:hypothetical protein
MKIYLLVLGLLWSGGLLTANALKIIDLHDNRDFFIGVFGGSAAGLGLSKKQPIESKPKIDPDDPSTWGNK